MKCTNRKQPPGAWDRIAELLRVTGMTANAFARHLGLPRGENLYQIKRGNNGISYDLARRIHAQYPNYSLSWLLTGEGEAGSGIGATVALPFCGDVWTLESPASGSGKRLGFVVGGVRCGGCCGVSRPGAGHGYAQPDPAAATLRP